MCHGVFGSNLVKRNGKDSEQSQKLEGKTEKVLKNCPENAKHAFFVIGSSRQV